MAKTKKKTTAKQPKDPQRELMKAFEKGLDLLYKKKWAAADKVFAGVAAQQPGTTVAERAKRFRDVCANRSSDSEGGDSYLNAVFLKNAGDFEASMEYCNRGGLKGRDERYAYLAASLLVLQENHDEGAKLLLRAIELNPANRVHAAHDSDFLGLSSNPDFAEIFAVD